MENKHTYLFDNSNILWEFLKYPKATPKRELPKSWKKYKLLFFPCLCNNYNNGLVNIYYSNGIKRDNIFNYSMFRDGCFHEICGRISKVDYIFSNSTLLGKENVPAHIIDSYFR